MAEPMPLSAPPATKQRKKASAACLSCRARRTKCNVEPGQTICSYCGRKNLPCVFQDDDERKKSASKARILELDGRVQMLEGMLKARQAQPVATESDQDSSNNGNSNDGGSCHHPLQEDASLQIPQSPLLPPARPPSADSRTSIVLPGPDLASQQQQQQQQQQQILVSTESPEDTHDSVLSSTHSSSHSAANSLTSVNTSKPVVAHLEETVTSLGCGDGGDDGARVRPYRHGRMADRLALAPATLSSTSREQRRQTDRLLEDVPPDTDAYLISLFFQYGNSMLLIVDREAFMHGKARGGGGSRSYSGFLHVVLLAMGLRYADHSRPDVARYLLPNRESTLHKGARYLVEYELECSQGGGGGSGIPSIQALLLLGDLEAACGRDSTGWMYGGMAIRLCFDVGLNLPPKTELPAWEWRNWRATLWACYMHDRYWSFYLGRPTSMKRSDIVASRLMPENKTLENQVFSALIGLMDIFTALTDNVEHAEKGVDGASYVFITDIYRKLTTWYSELPPALQWNELNIETAPSSFFLLHQQYHSSLILLHRDLAEYNNTILYKSPSRYHLALVSRTICFENAVKVAQIFARLRLRFDIRKVYFSAVQHAGTASTALLNGLSLTKEPAERARPLQHLRVLFHALRDMGPVYQPADRMSSVLNHSFVIARWNRDVAGRDVGGRHRTTDPSVSSKRKRRLPVAPVLVAADPNPNPNQNPEPEPEPEPELEPEPEPDRELGPGPPAKRLRNDSDISACVEQSVSIPLTQLFDSTLQFDSAVDMPHEQYTGGDQVDHGMDFLFPADVRDASWEPMLQLSPLQPRRANFLDVISGFDQLFQ